MWRMATRLDYAGVLDDNFSFRFDCDSEGMICVEELKFIMSNLPVKVSSQEIDEMVSAADLDGDGKINFQEFRKMIGQ
jgi:Ca2+-binding EF-hand superfamily protein